MKIIKSIVIIFSVLFVSLTLVSINVFAHSGGTDGKGGHYDHSYGTYHYHHGYPAHSHPNGECPYYSNSDQTTSNDNDNDNGFEGSVLYWIGHYIVRVVYALFLGIPTGFFLGVIAAVIINIFSSDTSGDGMFMSTVVFGIIFSVIASILYFFEGG